MGKKCKNEIISLLSLTLFVIFLLLVGFSLRLWEKEVSTDKITTDRRREYSQATERRKRTNNGFLKMDNLVYGIIMGGKWYSNRSEFKVRNIENGIYSMNMNSDDFRSTIVPANINDACKFFRKSSKTKVIRGISFHNGIVPENPVKYKDLPLKVVDPVYEEFEEIEVVQIKNKFYYFLQVVCTNKSYALMDVKDAFDKKTTLDDIKEVTPEIRMVFTFHWLERKQEELKKEILDPQNAIRKIMGESGANVQFVKKNNRGFVVQWDIDGNTINTQLNKDYRVIEAGFCVSNWDKTQSARSLVNVMKDYNEEGSSIYKTRVGQ